MFRRFWDCQRGNYALIMAIIAPPLLAGVGLVVDYTTLSNARAELQSALDAALLAASRMKDANDGREKTFQAVLDANLGDERMLLSYAGSLKVVRGANSIETVGTITARVRLNFMGRIKNSDKINLEAAAFESSDELEVAMVLDNTGSMGADGMKNLREAATSMVNILEGAHSENRNVRAALVPFVTAVNVKGEGYSESWIDTEAKAPLHGANFEPKNANQVHNHLDLFKHLKVDWKGCVEARPAPYNLDDTVPTAAKPSTLFVPYFAPDNPGAAAKSPNLATNWNNSYLGDSIGKSEHQKQKEIVRYFAASTPRYIDEKGPRSTGPNYACPTPINPLTSDFEKLKKSVSSMIHWEGSGTNVSEGLMWGMRVLSPQEPYNQGKDFKAKGVSKHVILFSDGENNVFGASNEVFNTSDYGAYGFLDSGRKGTKNRATALSTVNQWTLTTCAQLKANGVQIYTVLLGADTKANRDLYTKCASSPSNYYPTKDMKELRAIFEKIGYAIAPLHLTH